MSLKMSSHLPAIWHVPTGPFSQKLLCICITGTNYLELWVRPHPDYGLPGKGCTVRQAKHQRAGPLNQQSRGHRLGGRQEGGTWERAQTDTCPHLETTNSSSTIVEFTPKDTRYLTKHEDGGLGQAQPLPVSMRRSTGETSWTYKGQKCCEGIWR